MSKQILRSGTSIGANIAEAECLFSMKELYIALKEASETQYWLEFLRYVELIAEKQFSDIAADCKELLKILAATIKTLKKK